MCNNEWLKTKIKIYYLRVFRWVQSLVWLGVQALGLPHGCHQMSARPAVISRLSWTSGSTLEVEGTQMAAKSGLAVSRRAQCVSMGASPQATSVISWHGG